MVVSFGILTLGACQSTAPKKSGKYPYGKKVPGENGLVYSPYSESEVYIDVRGFKTGTEVKDPWTGKIFLVP
nr:4Fe-4S ferredoxin [uncultured bacterium]